MNPWVRALRKQFGELFLARSGKAGTEFQEKLGRRAINIQGEATDGSQIRLSPPNEIRSQKWTDFCLYYSLFNIHHSLFISAERIFK